MLNRMEERVLTLIRKGFLQYQIARAIKRNSFETRFIICEIYRKYGVSNMTGLKSKLKGEVK